METITISGFKARISEQLRKVRRGESILISDRETPIALVSPIDAEPRIRIRIPKAAYALPPPLPPIEHDPLEYLLAERSAR
jgi:prevent-host-death family protein